VAAFSADRPAVWPARALSIPLTGGPNYRSAFQDPARPLPVGLPCASDPRYLGRVIARTPSRSDAPAPGRGPVVPRITPPEAFTPLGELARRAALRSRIDADPERDALLVEYRRSFREQFLHDVAYNLATLQRWHDALAHTHGAIPPGLVRLRRLADALRQTDPWAGTRREMQHEGAAQEFYYSALTVADALLQAEGGGTFRAAQIVPRLAQKLLNELERAVPGPLTAGPWRGLLPLFCYHGMRRIIPGLPYRRAAFFEHAHKMISRGVLRRLTPGEGPVVERHDPAGVLSDPEFFDPRTGGTRHNIILALSHRHPTYDLPVVTEALRGLLFGVWATGLYFPRSAERDPQFVLVRPGAKESLTAPLARSVDLLEHARLPLLIAVDGIPPNLLYGQQARIKRGIRVLADHLQAVAARGRRTFIVPISFDDTVAFIQGRETTIHVTFHPPICMNDVAPAPVPPRPERLNWGDPLLSHLESLFLAHTGQVRYGWRTPCVAMAVRAANAAPRSRLQRVFAPSLLDLCRLGDAGRMQEGVSARRGFQTLTATF